MPDNATRDLADRTHSFLALHVCAKTAADHEIDAVRGVAFFHQRLAAAQLDPLEERDRRIDKRVFDSTEDLSQASREGVTLIPVHPRSSITPPPWEGQCPGSFIAESWKLSGASVTP